MVDKPLTKALFLGCTSGRVDIPVMKSVEFFGPENAEVQWLMCKAREKKIHNCRRVGVMNFQRCSFFFNVMPHRIHDDLFQM